jgi:hypothetical protein
VNREAELNAPSSVACSDLLGIRFIIFLLAGLISNYLHQYNTGNHKCGGDTLPKYAIVAIKKAKRCPDTHRDSSKQSSTGESEIK